MYLTYFLYSIDDSFIENLQIGMDMILTKLVSHNYKLTNVDFSIF